MSQLSSAAPRRPRTLSPLISYLLMGYVTFLASFASNISSPLYPIYQQQWHFDSFALTGIFAVYALGVLVSLLLIGRLSDLIGRRRVLLPALGLLIVAGLIFAFAQNLAWLVVARLVQGLATGALTATVGAALADLQPSSDPRRSAMVNTLCFTLGAGLGPLVGGLAVQYAAQPTVLPFWLIILMFLGGLAGVSVMHEPARPGPLRLPPGFPRPQRLSVPAALRPVFWAAAISMTAAWVAGALFGALGASIMAELLKMHSHVLAGLMFLLLNGVGGAAQVLLRDLPAHHAQRWGVLGLSLGIVTIAGAAFLASLPLFVTGLLLAGFGSGLAFLGGMNAIVSAAPVDQRAELLSSFYLVGYLALAIPVMVGGRLVDVVGLLNTVALFALLIVLLSALAAFTVTAARRAPGWPLVRAGQVR